MAENFTTDLSKLDVNNKSVIIANAKASGQTPDQYLASRGGVNLVTGQYGDAYDPATSLTDAEYLAARATGNLNAVILKKRGGNVTVTATADGDDDGTDGTGDTNATTYTAPDGKIFTEINAYNTYIAKLKSDEKARIGKSAYDILFSEFDRYGMGSLIEPLKTFIQDGLSEAELTLKLRGTEEYKTRFGANQLRINKGLRALSESEYIQLEDQYQDVMRRYGLPENYYKRGNLGRQEGFEKFIGGDVSPVELEDRVQTAQKRVINANPEVSQALKQFYPDINNSDILAYTLDPTNAIENIKRKVTAAEIGGAAIGAGLGTNVTRAEQLGSAGITKLQAQQGYTTIGGGLERGSQLASIYKQDPYTQTTAESEIFSLPGQAEAKKQRQKITGLEKATFGAQTGISSGALARDRAGGY